jgi:hypothetical protein
MVQLIVMSVFCIVLIVYGYGVVFKRGWLGKTKMDEQTSIHKMRNIMGIVSLIFGLLGLVINAVAAYYLISGGAV